MNRLQRGKEHYVSDQLGYTSGNSSVPIQRLECLQVTFSQRHGCTQKVEPVFA